MKENVVIGWVGTMLDEGSGDKRWNKWRPTVSVFEHEDFPVSRCELLYQANFADLMNTISGDIKEISPHTKVLPRLIKIDDPWNFSDVYHSLFEFSSNYQFDHEKENYFFHLTVGTHVSQICMFLLTEARIFPANLIQTSPLNNSRRGKSGRMGILDLGDKDFDRIRLRVQLSEQSKEDIIFLKDGIDTKNIAFNELIEKIENVAVNSSKPILLLGPTGAGKTKLARKIYELKQERRQVKKDKFIEVNCSTICGDGAMSSLFGHVPGAYTGATKERKGYLLAADKGLLFLDEIAELGLQEQAMLLRAIEEKKFLPLGSDTPKDSEFQLIVGTNANLSKLVKEGKFREDLLARIEHWKFSLPGLKERPEDIEPNIEYELQQLSKKKKMIFQFTPEAYKEFLSFAVSPQALWTRNFRDLNRAIDRMATFTKNGRITVEIVKSEIEILKTSWKEGKSSRDKRFVLQLLGEESLDKFDEYDLMQLEAILPICRSCKNMADATRILFKKSLLEKTSKNDSDRLRKFLLKFGIKWQQVQNLPLYSE